MNIIKQYIFFFFLAMGGVVEGENVAEEVRSGGTPLAKGARPW